MTPIPPALAAAYAERVTLTAPELCRLFPMDSRILKRHCQLGHIAYLQTGFELSAPRRFTLEHVMSFIERRTRLECPSIGRRGRPNTSTPSGGAGSGFLARLEKLRSERPAASASPGGFLARIEAERAAAANAAGSKQPLCAHTLRQRQAAERKQRVAERAVGKAKTPT